MNHDVDDRGVGVGGHNVVETELGSCGDAARADEVVAGVKQVEKAS